jgi:hypothetical protein
VSCAPHSDGADNAERTQFALSSSRRDVLRGSLLSGVAAAAGYASAAPRGSLPPGAFARNVEVIGYADMAGRPAFKMAIREAARRWYLYTGHFWEPGWSIVDVTDPSAPQVARFISGPENTWTLQMDLHGDTMITALEKIFSNFGGDDQPFEEGVLVWDIADPLEPRRLGHFHTGGTGTHRNLYAGGRYMHLAAGANGYSGNIYIMVNIEDRANPTEVGRWWVPGQHISGGEGS